MFFKSLCGITGCGSASLKLCISNAASPWSQSLSLDSQWLTYRIKQNTVYVALTVSNLTTPSAATLSEPWDWLLAADLSGRLWLISTSSSRRWRDGRTSNWFLSSSIDSNNKVSAQLIWRYSDGGFQTRLFWVSDMSIWVTARAWPSLGWIFNYMFACNTCWSRSLSIMTFQFSL